METVTCDPNFAQLYPSRLTSANVGESREISGSHHSARREIDPYREILGGGHFTLATILEGMRTSEVPVLIQLGVTDRTSENFVLHQVD